MYGAQSGNESDDPQVHLTYPRRASMNQNGDVLLLPKLWGGAQAEDLFAVQAIETPQP